MKQLIRKYEHESLIIEEDARFTQKHLNAFIALNNLGNNKYFTVIPNGVKFNHYVGVIQVDNLTVEILPKADKNNDFETKKKWQNVLLGMLKACGKVKINPYEEAHLKHGEMNLLELYFDEYLNEVQWLIRNGLVKQYRKQEGNVKTLKGKLNFGQNIRHNLVHKERFYTAHQVYNVDHKLHQVLAEALKVVRQFSSSMSINDKLHRVKLDFPEVSKINVTKQLLDTIHLNRKTEPYKRALELARLILLNFSPNVARGSDKMISILFDMNKLWEEYIVTRLRQEDMEEYKVLGKQTKTFWGNNRLQPDIVLQKGKDTFIIDTKWKIPGSHTSINDLRQMYAYGRFWQAKKIMLLYPGDFGTTPFMNFENDDFQMVAVDGKIEQLQHQCRKGVVSVFSKEKNKPGLNQNIGKEVLKLLKNEIDFR